MTFLILGFTQLVAPKRVLAARQPFRQCDGAADAGFALFGLVHQSGHGPAVRTAVVVEDGFGLGPGAAEVDAQVTAKRRFDDNLASRDEVCDVSRPSRTVGCSDGILRLSRPPGVAAGAPRSHPPIGRTPCQTRLSPCRRVCHAVLRSTFE